MSNMKKYPFQEVPGLDSIEAEGGETIKLPTGEVYEVKGASHSKGGVKLFAPGGSKVFSKRLKLNEDVVEEITGQRKKLSPAELSKKYNTDKFIDILRDPTKKYDDLSKRTAQLMLEKNNKIQEAIFRAQEEHKSNKGMRNDLDKSNYQSGGGVGRNYTWEEMQAILNQKQSQNPYKTIDISSGYNPEPQIKNNPFSVNLEGSIEQPTIGQTSIDPTLSDSFRTTYRSTYQPYAQDPYFTSGTYKRSGQFDPNTPQGKSDMLSLAARQANLTDVINYEGNDPYYQRLRKDYTKYLQEVDAKDPDKFLKKELVVDGKTIPLSAATQEQIDKSERTIVTNLRTGQRSLMDMREGNPGEATSNQMWNPTIETVSSEFKGLAPINALKPLESPERELGIKKDPEPLPTGTVPEQVPVGIDPQRLINSLQAGLLLGDLATLQKQNPYYTYRPTQMAYQRFEPLNTRQQERVFNLAKESIMNSNLPEAAKQAQLAQLASTVSQGVNQIDAQNYQGNLQVQNQNTSNLINAVNQDEQRRQEANLRYSQDEARGSFLYHSQKQEYRNQLFNLWRDHVENVTAQKLLNQLSRNYNFNPYSQTVEYQPGKGNPLTSNQLDAFTILQQSKENNEK